MKLFAFIVLLVGFTFAGYSQNTEELIVVELDADETDEKIFELQNNLSGKFVKLDKEKMECYFECNEHCEKDWKWLQSQDYYLFRKEASK